MNTKAKIGKLLIMGTLLLAQSLLSGFAFSAELPDFLYSKGGVIYPSTGDSTQDIFHTPKDIKEYLKPGMRIGVLPTDCKSASRGSIDNLFICDYDLFLQPEEFDGKTVYRVIELD